MKTAACELVGCEYPIFAFSHCRDVVAAVSKSGGLGVLGTTRQSPEELDADLRWIEAELHGLPYGVDLVLPHGLADLADGDEALLAQNIPTESRSFIDAIREWYSVPYHQSSHTGHGHGENLVLTHARARANLECIFSYAPTLFASALGPIPADIAARCDERGMVKAGLIGKPEHVARHLDAGADLIIAQGYEAGGHTGSIGGIALIPSVVEAAGGTPVVAAGGIVTGRQIVAALALGAAAVWTGSVWLTTNESETEEEVKAKLIRASTTDTTLSKSLSGRPIRQLRTEWSDAWERPEAPKVLAPPYQGLLVKDIVADIYASRVVPLMGTAVGQGVGQMRHSGSARDLFAALVQDMIGTFERLEELQS